jgi:hypothetical protein
MDDLLFLLRSTSIGYLKHSRFEGAVSGRAGAGRMNPSCSPGSSVPVAIAFQLPDTPIRKRCGST